MSAVRNSRTYDFDGVFHTCKCFVGLFSCTLNFLVHYVLHMKVFVFWVACYFFQNAHFL